MAAPLAPPAATPPPPWRTIVGGALVLLSVGLTTAGFLWLRRDEEAEWNESFQRRAETIGTLFDLRYNQADNDLSALRVLFENSDTVTVAEFEHASRTLIATDPDLAALEWVPVVAASRRSQFEADLRARGFADFAIAPPTYGALGQPASEADEYWPVAYLTPYQANRAAQGFDLRHGPTVAALTRARATRSLAVSPPLRLVQTTGDTLSVIFILPVYRHPDDVFTGWVQSIVHAPVLVRVACAEATRLGLVVAFDAIDASTGITRRLHASADAATVAGRRQHTIEQIHGGLRWRLSVWPDAALAAEIHTLRPWLVLLGGGTTTLLLALFIRATVRRAREIEHLVEHRTRELTSANQTLALEIEQRHREQQHRIEAERRLRETQKLESLGVLAGGIAHDFNNLLTTVLGQASLLRLDLPPTSPMQDNLAAIEEASVRAADLCQQMLAYSGCARCARRHLDLGSLVEETTRLARTSLGPNTELVLTVAPRLPAVHADPIQLRQIVMSPVANSSEALGGRPGTIAVTTDLIHANRSELDATLLGAALPEADYCLVEVRDTGCGMTPDTLAHIFEPFFTTKFTGRGLGLSAVLGIVRTHHGTLQVESTPGQGTDFRILLPVAPPIDMPGPAAGPGAVAGARRRILIVDDERSVRETAALVLQSSGFAVETADDGQAALEAFRRAPQDFVVVLLDYAMPRLDGAQTLAALRRISPTLPVVLMSGFGEQESFDRFGPHGPAAFLQKPFSATALIELIRRHLSETNSG